MTEHDWYLLFIGLIQAITALGVRLTYLRSKRNARLHVETKQIVEETKEQLNGKLTVLLRHEYQRGYRDGLKQCICRKGDGITGDG